MSSMKTLAAALFVLALVGGCPRPAPDPAPETTPEATATPAEADRATCCAQCAEGARTDPAGMDLSLEPCAGYAAHRVNGERVMTDACAAWFAQHPLMVQDCSL